MSRLQYFCCAAIVLLTLIALVLNSPGCSTPAPKPVAMAPTQPPPPPPTCDGDPVGTIKNVDCPQGQVGKDVTVCTSEGWKDADNTCQATPPPACTKTVFADVQPAISQYCGACHASWTTYPGAQANASAMAQRIALPVNNQQHMPQNGSAQLCTPPNAANDPSQATACDRQALLAKWVADGVNNACPDTNPPPPPPPSHLDEATIVGEMEADALHLNPVDRPFVRYLTLASAINEGTTGAALQPWIDAVNKGLNSLNCSTQDLKAVKVVDAATGLLRFDSRDYGMTVQDLASIENADVNINIVDNTSNGLVLQALLGTRKPFFDPQVFLDTAFRNAKVYYGLTRVPATLNQYLQQIGVNFAQDLAQLPTNSGTGLPQVTFIGNVGQITLQKPRLIVRDVQGRSTGGYFHQTFDVLNLQNIKNVRINGVQQQIDLRNLFVAPLLPGTGAAVTAPSQENLTQDASETIAQAPNGMQIYGLWDGQGKRLDAALADVVQDNVSQIAPEGRNLHVITAGNTCSRCHAQGVIPMADAILDHVSQNGDQFDTNDIQIVRAVYQSNAVNGKIFAQDQAAFTSSLGRLGIKGTTDPQAALSDHFLGNWNAKQLASFLWITPDQLTNCINTSPKTKSAIGTILSGTSVAFAQVEGATLKQLIADCRLFQDPIAQ